MHAHTIFNTIKTIQGKHGSKAKSDAAILSHKNSKKIIKKVLTRIYTYANVFNERR